VDYRLAKLDAYQERTEADRRDLKEWMKMMTANQAKTDAELTEEIGKTETELQTVQVSLSARANKFQEDLAEIRSKQLRDNEYTDFTLPETFNEACSAIEATKREFQAKLEEVKDFAGRGCRPEVCADTVQPPTFNGSSTWSVFGRQLETVAEHNQWSDKEKSTYLITTLKGRAAGVLPGIPTYTTYKDTLQALEDRFGDQHFAAAYHCQLRTRTQKPGESLQDFATAIELLARRTYPNLPADHIGREAGKAFVYEIKDADIKIQLLLGGEKTVNEALRQALELQAVLVAARPHEESTKTYRKYRSPPNQRRDRRQSGCWRCGELGHFGNNCPYERTADSEIRRGNENRPGRYTQELPRHRNEDTNKKSNQPSGNERRSAEKGNADVCIKAPPSRIDRHHGKCRS
jgi:hypothetical protein